MKHTHKYFKNYYRSRAGYTRMTWTCGEPDCSHFLPHNMESFIDTRITKCWECGIVFPLREGLDMDKPICMDCRGPGIRLFSRINK